MHEKHEAIIADLQKQVKEEWTDDEVNRFFLAEWSGNTLSSYHNNFGRYIRNNYNLWEIPWEPELINGVDHSPEHPDQVSMTLIEELWKRGIPA